MHALDIFMGGGEKNPLKIEYITVSMKYIYNRRAHFVRPLNRLFCRFNGTLCSPDWTASALPPSLSSSLPAPSSRSFIAGRFEESLCFYIGFPNPLYARRNARCIGPSSPRQVSLRHLSTPNLPWNVMKHVITLRTYTTRKVRKRALAAARSVKKRAHRAEPGLRDRARARVHRRVSVHPRCFGDLQGRCIATRTAWKRVGFLAISTILRKEDVV